VTCKSLEPLNLLSADVYSIFIIFTAIVLSGNCPGYSNMCFEISHNIQLCAFIQRFPFPFIEDSVKIIIADLGVIPQKR
jgi:hypothetical protein